MSRHLSGENNFGLELYGQKGNNGISLVIFRLISVAAHITVVIFAGIGDIFCKPFRGRKGVGFLFRRKFDFCQNKRREITFKNIKLNGIRIQRNTVALFGDEQSICFFAQVSIAFSGQWKIVFFPGHESAGFVSEKVGIILFADAHDRIGTQITLFDLEAWVLFQMFR